VSIRDASLFQASSYFLCYSSSVSLSAASFVTFYVTFVIVVESIVSLSVVSFCSIYFSETSFSSTIALIVVIVATASTFSLALFSSVFLLFSTTTSLFLWTLSFFLLVFPVDVSYSSSNLECIHLVAADAFTATFSSSFFWASSRDLSSSVILPKGLPCLFPMTLSYVLAPHWISSSSHVAEVYSHGTIYLLHCSLH
jgi:hypothetical protein